MTSERLGSPGDPGRIGPYQPTERLAHGEAADVWRARRVDGGLNVVLKRVLPSWSARAGVREAFIDAVKDAVPLHHDHLVQLLDFGETDQGLYAVFEAIEGPLLTDVLTGGGPLSPSKAKDLALGLLRGLAYIHQCANPFTNQPLVHGDVSPRNVLIDRHGRARISDIGFARLVHEGRLPGKPAPILPRYVAPEVRGGGVGLSPRSDVYGAGRVLEDLIRATKGPPDILLVEAARQATAEHPDARFANARLMLESLTPALPTPLPVTPASAGGPRAEVRIPKAAQEFLNRRYRAMAELHRTEDTYLYKVRDRTLDQVVALKLRLLDFDRDDAQRRRFEREMRLARAIRHPNVAKLHHLEDGEGFAFYTMEFAAGRTLSQRIGDGGLAIDEALSVFRQLAAALGAIHGEGLVHRDLRPDSVAVTPEGRAVLFDFGLMREEGQELSIAPPGAWTGLPLYTAPEQDSGRAADHRSDLFSFGAILHEVLTGAPAFKAPTEVAVYLKKRKGVERPTHELQPACPPEISQLVRDLTQAEPVSRPVSAAEVLARLG